MRRERLQECDQKYRNWESQRQEVEQQLGRCFESWEAAKGALLKLFEIQTGTLIQYVYIRWCPC